MCDHGQPQAQDRGPTPFQMFSLELREQRMEWFSRLSSLEVCRKIAEAWYGLAPAAKRVYYDRCHVTAGRPTLSTDATDASISSPSSGSDTTARARPVSLAVHRVDDPSDSDSDDRLFDEGSTANKKSRWYRYDSLGRRRRIGRPPPPAKAATKPQNLQPRQRRNRR
jgi:hypothetical protein